MKTYRIAFEELNQIYIEAKNDIEARRKFIDAEYDNPEYIATNMIEVEEICAGCSEAITEADSRSGDRHSTCI